MDRLTLAKRVIGVGSLVLGLAAVVAPRRFASGIGLQGNPEKVVAFGARELAAGSALLSPVKPSRFLWTRVAGDALDLWGLATALRQPGAKRTALGLATAAVLAITLLDVLTAREATLQSR